MATWLIILLVIAVALAPLMHFIPTKKQQATARLREQAALDGLFVTYRRLPMIPGKVADAAKDRTALEEGTLYYGVRWLVKASERPAPVTWLRTERGWQNLQRREVVLPDVLSSLPETVLAFSSDVESAGIYWREEGGQEALKAISSALLTLRDNPDLLAEV